MKYEVAILGCGSLGSNTALTLSRRLGQDVLFHLIDYDRIGQENLANQPWLDFNVGQRKAPVLASLLWHLSKTRSYFNTRRMTSVQGIVEEFSGVSLDLIMDCFDNKKSRLFTQRAAEVLDVPILHAGFSELSFMANWGDDFKISENGEETREPLCDRRDLAVIVQIGAALAAEAAYHYLINGTVNKYFFDLAEGRFSSYW